jgi:hypothetical protein
MLCWLKNVLAILFCWFRMSPLSIYLLKSYMIVNINCKKYEINWKKWSFKQGNMSPCTFPSWHWLWHGSVAKGTSCAQTVSSWCAQPGRNQLWMLVVRMKMPSQTQSAKVKKNSLCTFHASLTGMTASPSGHTVWGAGLDCLNTKAVHWGRLAGGG